MLVEILGAANEEIGMKNKQIRVILYKTATRFIFGPLLRKGDRRPLARCVHGEQIMDLYPDKDHTTYVGFKDERDGNVAV
jgi:hypothetical protein